MATQFEIDDEKVKNFTANAKDVLRRETIKYANCIIREANYIEDEAIAKGAVNEITGNTVINAVWRHSNAIRTKRRWISKSLSQLSMLVAGSLLDFNGYQNNQLKFILFLIAIITAVSTTVYSHIKE